MAGYVAHTAVIGFRSGFAVLYHPIAPGGLSVFNDMTWDYQYFVRWFLYDIDYCAPNIRAVHAANLTFANGAVKCRNPRC